ncbi:MAG: MFS transporter [Oscillospiraceae bacterium]
MENRKTKYAVAVTGTLLMLLIGLFYAWSLFRVGLSEFFPAWSSADVSLNFTLFIVFFCSGGLVGGKMAARFGRQKVMFTSAALLLIGLLVFTTIRNMSPSSALIITYLSYGVICGLGVGMSYNVIISGVTAWFPKITGLMSGILLTGFGFGSLIIGSAMMELAKYIGFFRTFAVTGAVLAVALVAASFLLRREPQSAAETKTDAAQLQGMTTGQMAKTPEFWLYFFWCIFISCSGLLVINSAANIAIYFGIAAALGLIVSLFNGFARIGMGAFFDRFGGHRSMILNIGLAFFAAIMLLLASYTGSVVLMFLGMLAAGATYGGVMALNPSIIKSFFGQKHFGTNFSLIILSGIPASFVGPYVSGLLLDASGGDYTSTFYAMLGFSIIGLVFFLILCRRKGSSF